MSGLYETSTYFIPEDFSENGHYRGDCESLFCIWVETWYFVVENVDVSEAVTRNLFHEENSNEKEEDDDDVDSADDSSSCDDDGWPKVVWVNCIISVTRSWMSQLQMLLLH